MIQQSTPHGSRGQFSPNNLEEFCHDSVLDLFDVQPLASQIRNVGQPHMLHGLSSTEHGGIRVDRDVIVVSTTGKQIRFTGRVVLVHCLVGVDVDCAEGTDVDTMVFMLDAAVSLIEIGGRGDPRPPRESSVLQVERRVAQRHVFMAETDDSAHVRFTAPTEPGEERHVVCRAQIGVVSTKQTDVIAARELVNMGLGPHHRCEYSRMVGKLARRRGAHLPKHPCAVKEVVAAV